MDDDAKVETILAILSKNNEERDAASKFLIDLISKNYIGYLDLIIFCLAQNTNVELPSIASALLITEVRTKRLFQSQEGMVYLWNSFSNMLVPFFSRTNLSLSCKDNLAYVIAQLALFLFHNSQNTQIQEFLMNLISDSKISNNELLPLQFCINTIADDSSFGGIQSQFLLQMISRDFSLAPSDESRLRQIDTFFCFVSHGIQYSSSFEELSSNIPHQQFISLFQRIMQIIMTSYQDIQYLFLKKISHFAENHALFFAPILIDFISPLCQVLLNQTINSEIRCIISICISSLAEGCHEMCRQPGFLQIVLPCLLTVMSEITPEASFDDPNNEEPFSRAADAIIEVQGPNGSIQYGEFIISTIISQEQKILNDINKLASLIYVIAHFRSMSMEFYLSNENITFHFISFLLSLLQNSSSPPIILDYVLQVFNRLIELNYTARLNEIENQYHNILPVITSIIQINPINEAQTNFKYQAFLIFCSLCSSPFFNSGLLILIETLRNPEFSSNPQYMELILSSILHNSYESLTTLFAPIQEIPRSVVSSIDQINKDLLQKLDLHFNLDYYEPAGENESYFFLKNKMIPIIVETILNIFQQTSQIESEDVKQSQLNYSLLKLRITSISLFSVIYSSISYFIDSTFIQKSFISCHTILSHPVLSEMLEDDDKKIIFETIGRLIIYMKESFVQFIPSFLEPLLQKMIPIKYDLVSITLLNFSNDSSIYQKVLPIPSQGQPLVVKSDFEMVLNYICILSDVFTLFNSFQQKKESNLVKNSILPLIPQIVSILSNYLFGDILNQQIFKSALNIIKQISIENSNYEISTQILDKCLSLIESNIFSQITEISPKSIEEVTSIIICIDIFIFDFLKKFSSTNIESNYLQRISMSQSVIWEFMRSKYTECVERLGAFGDSSKEEGNESHLLCQFERGSEIVGDILKKLLKAYPDFMVLFFKTNLLDVIQQSTSYSFCMVDSFNILYTYSFILKDIGYIQNLFNQIANAAFLTIENEEYDTACKGGEYLFSLMTKFLWKHIPLSIDFINQLWRKMKDILDMFLKFESSLEFESEQPNDDIHSLYENKTSDYDQILICLCAILYKYIDELENPIEMAKIWYSFLPFHSDEALYKKKWIIFSYATDLFSQSPEWFMNPQNLSILFEMYSDKSSVSQIPDEIRFKFLTVLLSKFNIHSQLIKETLDMISNPELFQLTYQKDLQLINSRSNI